VVQRRTTFEDGNEELGGEEQRQYGSERERMEEEEEVERAA
jgi:hypothetical protein